MSKEITVFAETTFRSKYRKFGIKKDDRRRHMYLIGKTGMGKSTVLENMIVEDIRNGHGVAVVDPHGDLAEKVIKFVPNERINDVVYFNPADYEYPIAFNILEQVDPHQRHLVASGLIGVFQKLWADSWGPRLEYILRNALLATLDSQGSTLLSVIRMLSDKSFRKKIVDNVQDPVVKAFWVNEFAGYADKFASEAVSPIQNKVGQFLSTSLIRNIVGQVSSTIDMRNIMDSGKIFIINLSKGRIGEDSSQLLGNMVITKIQLAAMSRVDTPEEERKDFYLYIDEFQNFTTDSFANILSEARKYKLNLIMAHQYIEQLGDVVRNAVFGNIGTMIVFRVGAADGEALEPEFTPTFLAEDIVNLPKYQFYLKLMIDGIASEPFSARGLLPLLKEEETNNVEKVIAVSRERYAKKKSEVEAKIAKWHAIDDDKPKGNNQKNNTNSNQKNVQKFKQSGPSQQTGSNTDTPSRNPSNQKNYTPQNNPPRNDAETKTGNDPVYKYTVNCSRCGVETKLSFKPDGVRPVFCKQCLSIAKDERSKELEERKKLKERELEKLSRSAPIPSPASVKQRKKNDFEKRSIPNPTSAGKSGSIDDGRKNRAKEMSLSDAFGMKPVNFNGKEINDNKAKREREDEEEFDTPPVFKKTSTTPAAQVAPKNEKTREENKQRVSNIEDEELDFVAGKSIDF